MKQPFLNSVLFLMVCLISGRLCERSMAEEAVATELSATKPAADHSLDYVTHVRPILQKHCYSCHSETSQKSGLRLDVKAEAFRGGELYGASILAGNPEESPLIQFVADEEADLVMPPDGEKLSAEEIQTLTEWVQAGAVWPEGVDLAKVVDRRDHWSFKPVKNPALPAVQNSHWPRNSLDYFILEKLEQAGLSPAPEAERAVWLRRVSLDLIGLPPSPQQLTRFLADTHPEAYENMVTELLASPRYGERWAQHWLDVVRYADTHGFEVNTERPNAWPYRDYVIEAMNADKPYDQFIREQIVGDAHGQDAATGFLVTASVLLPGQIGKDEPSKRLARQDSLDEIVVNISQSFLGLSVGCARCHDHKFDAISQRDYFAMQAFVAGVEYKDRAWKTEETEQQQLLAGRLQKEVGQLNQRLLKYVPLAQPGQAPPRVSNAKLNIETFPPVTARFVRFTIHNTNLHPSLGLIEPILDELEIYSEHDPQRNLALAGEKVKVTASGSRESSKHRLLYLNDGQYGNSRSWMSNEAGRGWVLLELPEPALINRIVWSRDREDQFKDRLPIAYQIEAGESLKTLQTVVDVPAQRPALVSTVNVDRIQPILTSRLRFTINATNKLEPCLDELEVFNVAGENVALASAGTKVKSSGDTIVADRHEIDFVNDGQYGNSRSWMSNEKGRGWIELEFSTPQQVERILWGRDRQGQFTDRLATDYHIEVADAEGNWIRVADSSDRMAYHPDIKTIPAFSMAGLSAEETDEVTRLLKEKRQLERQVDQANNAQLVFAGQFRQPDDIHLLRRGDPEQPADRVAPAVLSALDDLTFSVEMAEQQRRVVLADWITNPENPLTARVMANRIWLAHFGSGLVATPNDFGRNGLAPTHPELLDWLATEFMQSGWSIKHMHRLIVLSSAYRQTSQHNPLAAEQDADNQLLWSYPSRRLEGEAIRDSILFVSGQLNLEMGGPGFNLFDKRGGLSGFNPVQSFSGEGLRRLIYAHKVRRERDAIFGAFDCPDGGQSAPIRNESTTPIQALNLFNSQFIIEVSAAFANRVEQLAGHDVNDQIQAAYQLALNRQPSTAEISEAQAAVSVYGLPVLCRALLNCSEFLFIP